MTNHICVQSYLPYHVAAWVKAEAANNNESISVFVRDLVVAAYRADQDEAAGLLNPKERDRQAVFVSVAIDALLSVHSDPELRTKTHQAFARKLKRLGLIDSLASGDDR